jgi:AcrR family transcriptional regulator
MAKDPGIRYNKMEEAIIDAAGDLFDRCGYNQTSLQDIADTLGLARPSLYHYFSNKEDILVAGVDRIKDRRTRFVDEIRLVEGTPVERLRTLVREFALLISENPVWIRVLLREEPALPEETRRADYESRMSLFKLLIETIAAGVDEGSIRNLDEHVVAYLIVITVTGAALRYAAPLPDQTELASASVDVLMQGLLEPRPRRGNSTERGLELIREGMELIEGRQRKRSARAVGPGRR